MEQTAPRHGGEDGAAGAMCRRPRGLFWGEESAEEDGAERE